MFAQGEASVVPKWHSVKELAEQGLFQTGVGRAGENRG